MACLPCQQQRQKLVQAAKALDLRAMTTVVRDSVGIVTTKLTSGAQAVRQAPPYRRPEP